MMRRAIPLLAIALIAACAPPARDSAPRTTAVDAVPPPVVRTPLPPSSVGPAAESAASTAKAAPPVLPADALYVCVTERGGERAQTVIAFPSQKVFELCRKHPEMGPCQYERNACRKAGGRVYAAGGQEITLATEAEYDKKVMRWTFRSN
jgi:hypothetical protein